MQKIRIKALWQVSLILTTLFLSSIGYNLLLAQTRDQISHAEHEQLRAELEIRDATAAAKIAVLEQRIVDDELLIKRNTSLVDEHAATINRMEGIGISFGLALTIVQYMLFRAHHETRKKEDS